MKPTKLEILRLRTEKQRLLWRPKVQGLEALRALPALCGHFNRC